LTQISVFGLGPVGLVTAVCFARKGSQVIGIDPDRDRLEKIRRAESPFFEPKLKGYLAETVSNGAFSVTDDASMNARSDLAYITVGTPGSEDGSIDLTYVKNAAAAIGRSIRETTHYQLVVLKSTVIPGTARMLAKPILQTESGKTVGKGFGLCSNPEFLREGNAVHDAELPDRIVIGGEDADAVSKLENFYKDFHGETMPPVIRTTHESAELIKYANNAFLAMKVSFINTIANIAERTPNADVKAIAQGIGLDERIGSKFLNAGLGWGGSCFPKDLKALIGYSKSQGYEPELIEAAVATNEKQKRRAIQLAKHALGSLKGKRIAILGLAFKPETDDMREAVSIPLIRGLLNEGANVVAYDPAAMQNARVIFRDRITYANDPCGCVDQADCCIIATEWDEFKTITPRIFLERMRHPVVIDGRRIYNVDDFSSGGIRFSGIGLGPKVSQSTAVAK
jgi:UDPglucose 6-dehydrogenase